MTGLIVNHLWQSSCFALLAGLLAFALRKNSPKIRYWIWLSASLKFLVPFALLASLGSMIPRPPQHSARASLLPIPNTVVQVAEPFSPIPDAAIPAQAPSHWMPLTLTIMWAFGFLAVTLTRCRSWLRLRTALRSATPIELPIPIPALLTQGEEPGIVGVLRPILILPSQLLEHLTQKQLDAILTHELCHVRRRDNLFAAIHMAVEAIFWFNPLVWWIGSRMIEERERACDEEVLRTGCDPADYVQGILNVCRFHTEAPLPCVSGVTGADVKERLRAILERRVSRDLNPYGKAALTAAAAAVFAVPIALGVLNAPAVSAQSRSSAQSAQPALADVHPSPHTASSAMRAGYVTNDRYEIRAATMLDLIGRAYDMNAVDIAGGPSWIESDRFDILQQVPPGTKLDALNANLRAILTDRFKLVVHNDTKPMTAYVLTAGKHPLIKQSEGDAAGGCELSAADNSEFINGSFVCHNVTMADFAELLQNWPRPTVRSYIGANPVQDQTGLKGKWDLHIKWTGRGLLTSAGSDGITLFDALDKQAGLKLDLQKAPLPVLVVDSVNETPTPNADGITQKFPAVKPEFEVAEIKPSLPDGPSEDKMLPGGQVTIRGIPLLTMIEIAWNFDGYSDMIVNAPKFAESERFDMIAKAALPGDSGGALVDRDTLRLMLRALLADRFKLAAHVEEQPVTVYALVAANPKLKKADPSNRASCKYSGGVPGGQASAMLRLNICQNVTVAQFADFLATARVQARAFQDHPIVDATGLTGTWDFNLIFSSFLAFQPNAATTDPNGAIPLGEALEKQLGLRLETQKHPMQVLVIDHIEQQPTDN